ncbi:MAG: hypothetical protein MZV63_11040 [Marinilabiliales bacterium]|nr:hypothetical protein [Marinilabiliales bacterium]
MKIFTGTQIKKIDAATIAAEPIRSIDLMERAASPIARMVRDTLWAIARYFNYLQVREIMAETVWHLPGCFTLLGMHPLFIF